MSEVTESVTIVLRGDNWPELAALENAIRHMDNQERSRFFRKFDEMRADILNNPGIK